MHNVYLNHFLVLNFLLVARYCKWEQSSNTSVVPAIPPRNNNASKMCSSTWTSIPTSTNNFKIKIRYEKWVSKRSLPVWASVKIHLETIGCRVPVDSVLMWYMKGTSSCNVKHVSLSLWKIISFTLGYLLALNQQISQLLLLPVYDLDPNSFSEIKSINACLNSPTSFSFSFSTLSTTTLILLTTHYTIIIPSTHSPLSVILYLLRTKFKLLNCLIVVYYNQYLVWITFPFSFNF